MNYLEIERHGAWASLRFARPEKRNALNRAMRQGLLEELAILQKENVSVVVLTGADTWFCAGADLKERATDLAQGLPDSGGEEQIALAQALRSYPGLVLCALNGLALGFGVTLLNCADLAIASDRAAIGTPEIQSAGFASMAAPTSQQLAGLNRKRVAWMLFAEDRIDAERALEWGLVNEVIPHAELAARSRELAERICAYDPIAIAEIKQAISHVPETLGHWRAGVEYGRGVTASIKTKISQRADRSQT